MALPASRHASRGVLACYLEISAIFLSVFDSGVTLEQEEEVGGQVLK